MFHPSWPQDPVTGDGSESVASEHTPHTRDGQQSHVPGFPPDYLRNAYFDGSGQYHQHQAATFEQQGYLQHQQSLANVGFPPQNHSLREASAGLIQDGQPQYYPLLPSTHTFASLPEHPPNVSVNTVAETSNSYSAVDTYLDTAPAWQAQPPRQQQQERLSSMAHQQMPLQQSQTDDRENASQRSHRPSPLKLDLSTISTTIPVLPSDVSRPQSSHTAHSSTEQSTPAASSQMSQNTIAPFPQLHTSLYQTDSTATSHHNATRGLLPAFAGDPSKSESMHSQNAHTPVSRRPMLYTRTSQSASDSQDFSNLSNMSTLPDSESHASSLHHGTSASSPQYSGLYSPTSTLSGVFSSRPESRPASRGLKSMTSFTSSASTGFESVSDNLTGRSSDGQPPSVLSRTTSGHYDPSHPSTHQESPHNHNMQNPALAQSNMSSADAQSSSFWTGTWNAGHTAAQTRTPHEAMSGQGFQTPQMSPFSPTLTSPAPSQYSPHAHMGVPHTLGGRQYMSPSSELMQHSASLAHLQPATFDIAGFSEQRLSAALANSASISAVPSSARELQSAPTFVQEAETKHKIGQIGQMGQMQNNASEVGRTTGSQRHQHSQTQTEPHGLPHQHHHQHHQEQQQHQHHHAMIQQHHEHMHHQQYPHQQKEQAHYTPQYDEHMQQLQHQQPVNQLTLTNGRGADHQQTPMDMSVAYRMQMSYAPHMRPSLYQQVSMTESRLVRPTDSGADCSAFIGNYIRQYISCPSRLALGERVVLIMTTKVAQKSYGAEKRFLCPPPLVILIGSSWWNVCSTGSGPPGSQAQVSTHQDQTPTVLSPPRLTINISGESGIQDGVLEWASSSGRLIDVGYPSSEMAISGRCIGKQLYISDVDEKRRHVEALVSITVPGATPGDRKLLGTFSSKPIKVISKPSKKRQSSRNTELCVNHGSVISLFHRLRSQTVSTRYLCVSGAPSWFKGSDNQPFLNMNPRDQKGQEPPSCFVAKMSSWDPFIVYLVDPKKRPDANPAEPLQPAIKGYPPPPPNALPTSGLTSSQMTVHYNQPIVLQCLNTAVVSPVMVIRKVDKGTNVLGGATSGTGSATREAFGDPVSQLHKIALEVLENHGDTGSEESADVQSLGQSGPFLACLNESVGMHRPTESRKWVTSNFSMPSTPTTPVTPVPFASSDHAEAAHSSAATASAYAAAQTRHALGGSRASFVSSGSSSASHAAQTAEASPSSDGGKVKRARRLSSLSAVQKERAAAAAASKNRRRGQSLSTGLMQSMSDADPNRRTGSHSMLSALDQPTAGSTNPGAVWSVEVADSDIWTVVGTDIARHSFYVPPQIVGGSESVDSVSDSNIAHLITVPAPGQPITPIPILLNVVAPGRDGRSPMPPNQPSDQGPQLVTLLGENFEPGLLIYFGDWKSEGVEIRSTHTVVCSPPPSFEAGLPRGRVPILLVRQDGVIFPTDFHYQC